LGDAQSRKGQYEAALASFQRALRLDPQNLLALRGAGHSLIYLKRYREALQEFEEAIKIYPGDSELYFELSQVQARMGNREKAAEATATFQRLHAEASRKQDAERKRSFMPEATRSLTEQN